MPFDIRSLYDALESTRDARNISWADVARELNAAAGGATRPIAVSTIAGWKTAAVAEADGLLQAMKWLRRAPESFVVGREALPTRNEFVDVPSGFILRFDAQAIYKALDEQRRQRGLSWAQAAAEIGGVTAPSLSRLSRGGRVSFPSIVNIAAWLDRPCLTLTKVSKW